MAGDMIFIGCKMPNGVELNLTKYEVTNKERGSVRRVGDLSTVTLKGNAVKVGPQEVSIDGYVFTAVPKDFWEVWLKDHQGNSLLVDGFIKPAITMDEARGIAAEMRDVPGQNERLTETDPRIRGLGVEMADEMRDRMAA